jgi:hypothetical protein
MGRFPAPTVEGIVTPWREWWVVYDKMTPRLILIFHTYSWGLPATRAWLPDRAVSWGGRHVLGEAQSEHPIGASVRTQHPTVLTVRDMGLGHPDQDVSRGSGPRRPG